MRILLVEDEIPLAEALAQVLKKTNYTVDCAFDGESGLDCALSGAYDLILLDVMLPKVNGIKVLKNFRKVDRTTPVIMLTAKGEVSDKVQGLDFGADDYLAKPFNIDELLARIRSVTRRNGQIVYNSSSLLSYGDFYIDISLLKLFTDQGETYVTLKESELLECLVRNSTVVLSKEKIIEKVWGYESNAEDNHVEVYISFLRKKLACVKSEVQILTIRGVGYKLCFKD